MTTALARLRERGDREAVGEGLADFGRRKQPLTPGFAVPSPLGEGRYQLRPAVNPNVETRVRRLRLRLLTAGPLLGPQPPDRPLPKLGSLPFEIIFSLPTDFFPTLAKGLGSENRQVSAVGPARQGCGRESSNPFLDIAFALACEEPLCQACQASAERVGARPHHNPCPKPH